MTLSSGPPAKASDAGGRCVWGHRTRMSSEVGGSGRGLCRRVGHGIRTSTVRTCIVNPRRSLSLSPHRPLSFPKRKTRRGGEATHPEFRVLCPNRPRICPAARGPRRPTCSGRGVLFAVGRGTAGHLPSGLVLFAQPLRGPLFAAQPCARSGLPPGAGP